MSADDLAAAFTSGGAEWLVLSIAAVLPILWAFTLALHFARPYVLRFLQGLTLRFGGESRKRDRRARFGRPRGVDARRTRHHRRGRAPSFRVAMATARWPPGAAAGAG